jgi:anti-anti-sigma factor
VPKRRPLLAVVPTDVKNRLKLHGEADISTVSILRIALQGLEGDFTLDLSELTFMDSSGLHAIMDGRRGITVTLVGVRPIIMRVLEVAGFLDGRHGLVVIPHEDGHRRPA